MKVSSITPIKTKDGKDIWKVSLEGTDKPLWLQYAPKFEVGSDIPDDSLQLSSKGTSYIMKRAEGGKAPPRYFKNDDDIMLQVALKAAVELEKHHFVPEGKINIPRIAQATNELFANLLLMRPKAKHDN